MKKLELVDRLGIALFRGPVALSCGFVFAVNYSNIARKLEADMSPGVSKINEKNFFQRFAYGYRMGHEAFVYPEK